MKTRLLNTPGELVYHKEYTVHTYETDARGVVRPVALEVSYRAEALYGDEVLAAAQRVPDPGPGPAFLHRISNAATGTELVRARTRWE